MTNPEEFRNPEDGKARADKAGIFAPRLQKTQEGENMSKAEKAFEEWLGTVASQDPLNFKRGNLREVRLEAWCAGAEWAAKRAQEIQTAEPDSPLAV